MQGAKALARALAADCEAARMRTELAETRESLAMAKSLFSRAAQANDLEEQLKARRPPQIFSPGDEATSRLHSIVILPDHF
jgi:hypothetical protein